MVLESLPKCLSTDWCRGGQLCRKAVRHTWREGLVGAAEWVVLTGMWGRGTRPLTWTLSCISLRCCLRILYGGIPSLNRQKIQPWAHAENKVQQNTIYFSAHGHYWQQPYLYRIISCACVPGTTYAQAQITYMHFMTHTQNSYMITKPRISAMECSSSYNLFNISTKISCP